AAVVAALALWSGAATAGGIGGTIRDAVTLAPIAGIDLDVFDAAFAPAGLTATTAADGTDLLSPLPAGDYFVRADPTVVQQYVDQWHPGVFLKSQATSVAVADLGTVTVDFALQKGGSISGHVYGPGPTPLVGCDLDVFASNQEFLGSINASTDATGFYRLGAFPVGDYYLRAQPLPAHMSQQRFFNNKLDLATANPVHLARLNDRPN